jgi:hypothetical protein
MTQKLSLQTRGSHTQRLSATDLPSSSTDSLSRWVSSPLSSSTSPGARHGWPEYGMGPRSPSNESAAASLVLDPELFVPSRSVAKPSPMPSNPGTDDVNSVASRSQRGSYDQGMFPDAEADLTGEEVTGLRNLSWQEPHRQLERQVSRQGLKRRALSPPSEMARDDKTAGNPGELFQKLSSSNPASRSPAASYRSQAFYSSVSSTTSSIRQISYPSSFAPSLAPSSLTSTSSLGDRLSTHDSLPHTASITSAPLVDSPASAITSPRNQLSRQSLPDSKSASRKMSIHTAIGDSRVPTATRIGSFWICDCCPKKPKKFESEDDLR